jgi:hypothetical protein
VRLETREHDLSGGAAGPDGGEWPTSDDEVPGAMLETNHRIRPNRYIDELRVADELQIAAHVCCDGSTSILDQALKLANALRLSANI